MGALVRSQELSTIGSKRDFFNRIRSNIGHLNGFGFIPEDGVSRRLRLGMEYSDSSPFI